MLLYDHPASGNCHKVRLLCSFLDLSYESRTVKLLEGEQHEDWFQEINPRGEVPVLEDDGERYWDSQAILVYIAEAYDDEDYWYPNGATSMGQVQQWLALSAGEIQGGLWAARAIVAYDWDLAIDLETAQERAEQALTVLQKRLSDNDWLVDDHETIADIACFPYVAMAEMGDVSLAPYPGVVDWLARFQQLSGYVDMDEIPRFDES